MSQFDRDTLTDPTTGAELAGFANDLKDHVMSQGAGASRPPRLAAGGLWAKDVSAGNFEVYLYDGSADTLVHASATAGAGKLLNIQKFTASGTYTPTPGTKFAIIEAVGATGAGGGADADTSGTGADGGVGGGAAGGGTVIVKADVSAGGYSATIVIGAAGTGVSQAKGGAGGDTSYDDGTNSFTIPGTDGGDVTIDNVNVNYSLGSEGVVPVVTGFLQTILAVPGEDGGTGLSIPTNAVNAVGKVIGGQSGGSALLGGGRRGAAVSSGGLSNAGNAARMPGEGGSGAAAMGTAAPVAGGDGFRGEMTIYEYAV